MATLAELGGVGDTTTEYHRPHRMHPGIGIAMKNPQKNGLFPDLQQTINCRCFWRHGGTIFVVALRSHVSLSTSEF